jgi:hypothetical protein
MSLIWMKFCSRLGRAFFLHIINVSRRVSRGVECCEVSFVDYASELPLRLVTFSSILVNVRFGSGYSGTTNYVTGIFPLKISFFFVLNVFIDLLI